MKLTVSHFFRTLAITLLTVCAAQALAQDNSAWGELLDKYVIVDERAPGSPNLFAYGALANSANDTAKLDAYIDLMALQAPSVMERSEAIVYWANLYNALTVQVVSENWPVSSIKQIKSGVFTSGPWKRKLVTVEGRELSLDEIEHDILRVDYADPRIHYMVNCASIGCPDLRLEPWEADSLEVDMDMAAIVFVNSPRGASVTNGKLTISSIYHWFAEDFGDSDEGVISHLTQYAAPELKQKLQDIDKVSDHDYNWAINSVDKR